MGHEVFISHSHLNLQTAEAICMGLERRGIRCWIAPRDIMAGAEYSEAIITGIEDCRVFLVILSAAANTSHQVRREVERAASKDRPILTFLIEDVPASKALEYHLNTRQWLKALTPPLDAYLAHLEIAVVQLLGSNLPTCEGEPGSTTVAFKGGGPHNSSSPALAPSLGVSRPSPSKKLKPPRLLVIEDDKSLGPYLAERLEAHGYDVAWAVNPEKALVILGREEPDAFDTIISDIWMPTASVGFAGISVFLEMRPFIPVIVITSHEESADEAIKMGVYDYVFKDGQLPEVILRKIPTAIRAKQFMTEKVRFGLSGDEPNVLIGNCPVMQNFNSELWETAKKSTPILVYGEPGTEVELAARLLYRHRVGGNNILLPVNCNRESPKDLAEEIFGREGRSNPFETVKIGRLEQANQGTVFLGEIDKLPIELQDQLSQGLEGKFVTRLRGTTKIPIHTRLLATTHLDPKYAVLKGSLSLQLYHQFKAGIIHIPPLRERLEDIPELVKYFLLRNPPEGARRPAAITEEALRELQLQPWPGNVRQLEKVIAAAMKLADRNTIGLEQIRNALRPPIA